MKWVKIEDGLPKKQEYGFYQVLVYRMHSPIGSQAYEVMCWENGNFYDNTNDEIDINLITHWAYIPEILDEVD
jgi:hypothetical protein